jgi:peptide/nickel transport system permease protein
MPEAVPARARAAPAGRRVSRSLARVVATPAGAFVAALLLGFVVTALFADQLAPFDPGEANLLGRLAPPAWAGGPAEHLLGTDQLGRDILSRLIHGSRVALVVGLAAVSLAVVIGVTLGLVAGYAGGTVDAVISRLIDALIAIPNVLLYLTVLGVAGPGLSMLVLLIGCLGWTTFARVVRAETLSLRRREFVEAARALGQRTPALLLRHVLPAVMAPIIVVATLNVASVIILEASLSFLGLGVQPPTVTWGRMLADGRGYVATAWWLATFPGVCITLLCVSLLLLGDRLRDVLDPRLLGR